MKQFITSVVVTVVHVNEQNGIVRVDEQEWAAPSLSDEDAVFTGITQEQLRDVENFLFEYEERPRSVTGSSSSTSPKEK